MPQDSESRLEAWQMFKGCFEFEQKPKITLQKLHDVYIALTALCFRFFR